MKQFVMYFEMTDEVVPWAVCQMAEKIMRERFQSIRLVTCERDIIAEEDEAKVIGGRKQT